MSDSGNPGPSGPGGCQFGRCFTDVARAETISELADSFRLENCVVRERLAAVLSASAR